MATTPSATEQATQAAIAQLDQKGAENIRTGTDYKIAAESMSMFRQAYNDVKRGLDPKG